MTATVSFRALDVLLDGHNVTDVPCLWCGPSRRSATNQKRKTLRLWAAPNFVSYYCCRCGERGSFREDERRPVNREALQRTRVITAKRERIEAEQRQKLALALWRMRRPIHGTVAEKYLRDARGIGDPLPQTLGYLPPRGEYPPSLIACFGIPDEPEPGAVVIADRAIVGVHLTKLLPDGSGKAEVEPNKIMVGRSLGSPIVLASMNDLLGLAITEGIEDGLSALQATGVGAWAAGAASRMPALAEAVPASCDCVSIFADSDEAGQRHAAHLAQRINARGIFAEVVASGVSA